MGPISYTETSVGNYQFNLLMSHKSGNLISTAEKKWIRTFFNSTSKFWDLEFISWLACSTASCAPAYGQAEVFCCRMWDFYSKRVGEGYVSVSAVAMILPLFHTHILFMYHQRCIISAVECIVKYDTPQFPFYPVPVHICSTHRCTLNYYAMLCCSTALYRITSRNCFWHAEGCPAAQDILIPYRVYEKVSLVSIVRQTEGTACAECEMTAWHNYRERERESESELHVRVCTVLPFFLSVRPHLFRSFLPFCLSFFLSSFSPSFLHTFGFCLLSAVNVYLLSAVNVCVLSAVNDCVLSAVNVCLLSAVNVCVLSAVDVCVLSAVNVCLYQKSFFQFVFHKQANFKLHASAMLATALLGAIGVLWELVTYIHNTHTHTHTQTYIRTYIHTDYIHTYIYTHTHTHIHTDTYRHTYTHTYLLTYLLHGAESFLRS